MKRHLLKRVFAAAALATLAAGVSACGSSNNNTGPLGGIACAPGVLCSGVAGAAVTNTGTGCTISFAGNGVMDYSGGLSGTFGVSGEQTGMVTTPGGFMAGLINQTDGSVLELNFSATGAGYYAVNGVLSMGPDEAPQGCTMPVSQITMNTVGIVQESLGQPFSMALQGGTLQSCQTGFGAVFLNGSSCVPTW